MSSEIGKEYEYIRTVEKLDLASAVGSGGMDVLSSPTMITWMEIAAMKCIDVENDEICSLGIHVSVEHIAATPLGSTVRVYAKLIQSDGRKFVFEVSAFDEMEKIGFGTHVRATTKISRLTEKVNAKIKSN